uniref:Uncharacterized protein n=1 Tax=Schistocephalus solidus TaxID=70667 RepID=A0A0X3PDI8_SCHSO
MPNSGGVRNMGARRCRLMPQPATFAIYGSPTPWAMIYLRPTPPPVLLTPSQHRHRQAREESAVGALHYCHLKLIYAPVTTLLWTYWTTTVELSGLISRTFY